MPRLFLRRPFTCCVGDRHGITSNGQRSSVVLAVKRGRGREVGDDHGDVLHPAIPFGQEAVMPVAHGPRHRTKYWPVVEPLANARSEELNHDTSRPHPQLMREPVAMHPYQRVGVLRCSQLRPKTHAFHGDHIEIDGLDRL